MKILENNNVKLGLWVVVFFPCGKSLISKHRLIKDLPNDVQIIYGFSSYEKAFDYIQRKNLCNPSQIMKNNDFVKYVFE